MLASPQEQKRSLCLAFPRKAGRLVAGTLLLAVAPGGMACGGLLGDDTRYTEPQYNEPQYTETPSAESPNTEEPPATATPTVAMQLCTGSYEVTTESELQELANCVKLDGSLTIRSGLSFDLGALKNLEKITGELQVTGRLLSLRGLENLRSVGALTLTRVTGGLAPLSNLSGSINSIQLSTMEGVKNLEALSGVTVSTRLEVEGMYVLESLAGPAFRSSVDSLVSIRCPLLTDFSELRGLKSLEVLSIGSSFPGRELELPQTVESVGSVNLSGLPQLETLSSMAGIQGVHSLRLRDLPQLSDLGGRNQGTPESLQQLSLENCPLVTQLEPLGGLAQLSELIVVNCGGLTELNALARSAQLRFLQLEDNDGLISVASLDLVEEMDFVLLRNNSSLVTGPQFPLLKTLSGEGHDLAAFGVGALSIIENASLESIGQFPQLQDAYHVQLVGNSKLTEVSLPAISRMNRLEVRENQTLTEVTLPLLAEIFLMGIMDNRQLTSLTVSNSLKTIEALRLSGNDILPLEQQEHLRSLADSQF